MTETSKLDYLLRLPWTFVREITPEGDTVLRVAEVPSAVGTGGTDTELEADAWASLRASLESYLHFGDPIPLPPGSDLPWAGTVPEDATPSTVLVREKLRLPYLSRTAGTHGSVPTSQ